MSNPEFDSSKYMDEENDISFSQKKSHEIKGGVHSHFEESIRPFIDLIDKLRSVGVQKDLALPTIVVIGDQSSGKSSVLEALSGVALPRGSGIVTRCPLELRLKKVKGGVSWMGVLSYRDKEIQLVDSSSVTKQIETAQNELAGKGVKICNDLITLEVMSPEVCDLTLIDLPGIARVPVQGQPEDIGNQIKKLILKFIERKETLNLVVVPCNTDIATTEALKMAQEVDPEGKRTIAILTKPDLIDKGTEKNILAVIHNKVIPLRKGYIMVKCRGQQQIDDEVSLEEATQMEREFFKKHDHFRSLLTEKKATVKCLSVKLTQNLVDHIKKSLPQLKEQVTNQLWDVKIALRECECGPPEDPKGARQFLVKDLGWPKKWLDEVMESQSVPSPKIILTSFNDQIKALSSGEWISTENIFSKLRGHFKSWNDRLNSTKPPSKSSEEISQNFRGRELFGFISYSVFERLLQEHMSKFKNPATELLNDIKDITYKELTDVSFKCFQNYPALQNITENKIRNIQSSQEAKTEMRILEQFKMENMIYTQDPIYLKILQDVTGETLSEERLPFFDVRVKYDDLVTAYYEIVVRRMADQLPMIIMFFMLKETVQLLCVDMLSLLDGTDVSELLFEDSEVGRRRRELHARLDRLAAAQEALSDFI